MRRGLTRSSDEAVFLNLQSHGSKSGEVGVVKILDTVCARNKACMSQTPEQLMNTPEVMIGDLERQLGGGGVW